MRGDEEKFAELGGGGGEIAFLTVNLGEEEMDFGNAVGAVGVCGEESGVLGVGEPVEVEVGKGAVVLTENILDRSDEDGAIGVIERVAPVILLRGEIGQAELSGSEVGVGDGGLSTGGFRVGQTGLRGEDLAENGPGLGIVGIETNGFAEMGFGLGELEGMKVGTGFGIFIARFGRGLECVGRNGGGGRTGKGPVKARDFRWSAEGSGGSRSDVGNGVRGHRFSGSGESGLSGREGLAALGTERSREEKHRKQRCGRVVHCYSGGRL